MKRKIKQAAENKTEQAEAKNAETQSGSCLRILFSVHSKAAAL